MFNVILFSFVYFSGFILSFTRVPVYAFVVYEAVYFFHPANRWWGYMIPNLSYSFYTVVLMFFVFVRNYKAHNSNALFTPPQFKWVYLILLGYGFTSFWAINSILHQEALIYFLKLVITITIAYKLIDSHQKLNYALWGYIFGAWYISFIAFQTGRNRGNRLEGIGTVDSPDSNGISAALAPTIVICLYYFWTTKNKYGKLLFAIAGVFLANSIILINSRGAFLAVAISILYFIFHMLFSKHKRHLQKSAAISIILLGIAGTAYIVDDTFINRVYTMTTSNSNDHYQKESGSTRVVFWKAAWNMTLDHPAGLGIHGFDAYAPFYIPNDVNTGSHRNRSVHSTWFEALTELGYYGLFCLIAMLYACYWSTKQCRISLLKNKDIDNYYKIIAIEAFFLAFIIAMTFLNRFRAEILYWLVMFTACAYNIYVIKPKSESKP